MIITAVLAMIVLWCLFYGYIPGSVLISLCIVAGGILSVFGRHRHDDLLMIDILARKSRLYHVNALLKFGTIIILMILCISSDSVVVGMFLAFLMLLMTVIAGGIKLRTYLSLMVLPVSFLLLSGLGLLFEFGSWPAGVLYIPFFHGYLYVSRFAQVRTALIMSKAFGTLSCLYLFSLSTPMSEIIGVLRKVRVPGLMIELMYLIYRYTFLVYEMYHSMKSAASSRLGDVDFPTRVKTTGSIFSNLLARSYRKASEMLDVMESRCFDGEIRFWEKEKNVTGIQILTAAGMIVLTLLLMLGLH